MVQFKQSDNNLFGLMSGGLNTDQKKQSTPNLFASMTLNNTQTSDNPIDTKESEDSKGGNAFGFGT